MILCYLAIKGEAKSLSFRTLMKKKILKDKKREKRRKNSLDFYFVKFYLNNCYWQVNI